MSCAGMTGLPMPGAPLLAGALRQTDGRADSSCLLCLMIVRCANALPDAESHGATLARAAPYFDEDRSWTIKLDTTLRDTSKAA